MDAQKVLDRLERLHKLITRKATGSPAELARKLGATERTVYNWISLMKSMGAPIVFCRQRQTYKYEREVEFFVGFRELTKSEERDIEGGFLNFIPFFF